MISSTIVRDHFRMVITFADQTDFLAIDESTWEFFKAFIDGLRDQNQSWAEEDRDAQVKP
jgi:hypothetical protein